MTVIHLKLSCRGRSMNVPAMAEDPAEVVVEFVRDAFDDVRTHLVKIVHRGRRLLPAQSLATQGVHDGAKLLILAAPAADCLGRLGWEWAAAGCRSGRTTRPCYDLCRSD